MNIVDAKLQMIKIFNFNASRITFFYGFFLEVFLGAKPDVKTKIHATVGQPKGILIKLLDE